MHEYVLCTHVHAVKNTLKEPPGCHGLGVSLLIHANGVGFQMDQTIIQFWFGNMSQKNVHLHHSPPGDVSMQFCLKKLHCSLAVFLGGRRSWGKTIQKKRHC